MFVKMGKWRGFLSNLFSVKKKFFDGKEVSVVEKAIVQCVLAS